MSTLVEYLAGYPFARYALAAGIMVAVLGALVGFFVVLRRMAFVAVGVSHAALGGVAVGVLLHQSPILWAVLFSIAVALAMSALGRRGMSEDTAMGVFFPAAMAFGVIVIGMSKTYQQDLLSYLFGNILAVREADLWLLGAVTLGVALTVWIFFKELLYVSFDEESAHAAGVPVAPIRTVLLVLTAVAVVVAIKVVGVVVVSAMFVIPSATSAQLTHRWQSMLAGALVAGVVSLVVGLWISFSTPADMSVPTGPAAVVVAAALFGLSALVGGWRTRREQRSSVPTVAAPQGL